MSLNNSENGRVPEPAPASGRLRRRTRGYRSLWAFAAWPASRPHRLWRPMEMRLAGIAGSDAGRARRGSLAVTRRVHARRDGGLRNSRAGRRA